MRIFSWNVNGIRAVEKKGFLGWFTGLDADIVCVQETKAAASQVPASLRDIPGYQSYFTTPVQKGYSGVGLWSKHPPKTVSTALGVKRFDEEGRLIEADFGSFILFNVYFPNGKASDERLQFKMDFYDTLLARLVKLSKAGRQLVICGDVNTAHTEIDLARPQENSAVSGFLPEERAWIDKLIASGFIDSFRRFHKEPGNYTWWDLKSSARSRNVGWRIDYFFISAGLSGRLKDAFIQSAVYGSDHCPVGIELSL